MRPITVKTVSLPGGTQPSAGETARNRLRTDGTWLFGNRLFMAGMLALALVIYLWNAPHVIDYPVYDESSYFDRGVHLLAGDWASTHMQDPGSSPLYVVYYALWYALLHTSQLYAWVLPSTYMLLGLGAYLLLSRLLHPTLAWALALFTVLVSAPVVPLNGCYYFGAGLLWISLSLLGKRVALRGLAACGVLAATFVRSEFLIVLLLLLALLAIYEWRRIRALPSEEPHRRARYWLGRRYGPVLLALLGIVTVAPTQLTLVLALVTLLVAYLALRLRTLSQGERRARARYGLALSYLPVALGCLTLAYLRLTVAPDYREVSAIPWSYNDYLRSTDPAHFSGINNFAEPFVLFERDFGPVQQPHTVVGVLAAMTHEPGKLLSYLGFEARRLVASFSVSPFETLSWRFWLGTLAFALAASLCYVLLRRASALGCLPLRHNTPALLGVGSLAGLIPWLLFIVPQQRYWMLFPLVLMLFGYIATLLLTWLFRTMRVPSWTAALVVVVLMLHIPQPYIAARPQPIATTIAFIRVHVANGSTIVGEPVTTYARFLATEGIHLTALDAGAYQPSALVDAMRADPTLRYALLTDAYSPGVYAQWFADWSRAFPHLRWVLVAQNANPYLRLYRLG